MSSCTGGDAKCRIWWAISSFENSEFFLEALQAFLLISDSSLEDEGYGTKSFSSRNHDTGSPSTNPETRKVEEKDTSNPIPRHLQHRDGSQPSSHVGLLSDNTQRGKSLRARLHTLISKAGKPAPKSPPVEEGGFKMPPINVPGQVGLVARMSPPSPVVVTNPDPEVPVLYPVHPPRKKLMERRGKRYCHRPSSS